MSKQLSIDYETAHRITLITLKDYREYLQMELDEFKNGAEWLHPEDVTGNTVAIEALDLIISHFE